VVRGDDGEERDRFVELAEAVLADFELRAILAFEPPGDDGPNPQLVINDEVIVRGLQGKRNFKTAVRKTISDW
jgi:hypothetical protein